MFLSQKHHLEVQSALEDPVPWLIQAQIRAIDIVLESIPWTLGHKRLHKIRELSFSIY